MTPEQNEIRTRWVAALRSGAYKQGRGFLHKDGRYCCLGVLCDLAVKAGVVGEELITSDAMTTAYGGSTYNLPPRVQHWAGVPRYNALADMNDGGESFATIATLIESNPAGLFK